MAEKETIESLTLELEAEQKKIENVITIEAVDKITDIKRKIDILKKKIAHSQNNEESASGKKKERR
ncbi:MAG TPA: hypothetical protein PKY81_14270 [bacterium]|jgi:hypothetical protein|nr:hypothetical protein [bacterium]